MSSMKTTAETSKNLWRIPEWYPEIEPSKLELLKAYYDELLKFNKTINLISPKTAPFADAIHFADCILACKEISNTTKIDELYDIGSGNGFPGVIYAILNPQTKVKLVESDQRKAEFLKHLTTHLRLSNVEVINQNAEKIPQGSIKFAISRGFASIAKTVLVARKLTAVGGVYFHLKGEEWGNEIAEIPTQLCSFWIPSLLAEYRLPIGEVRFAVVKTEKISE